MRTYTSGSLSNFIAIGSLCLFIGSIFVCVGGVLLIVAAFDVRHADAIETGILGAAGFFAGIYMLLVGRRFVWSLAFQVRVGDDGYLEFISLVRSQTMLASDLVAIDRRNFPLPMRGLDPREIVLRTARGSAHVPYFTAIDVLIGDIQVMNPTLVITGNWG